MFNLYEQHKHHVMNLVMVVVFIVFFGIGMYLLTQRGSNFGPNTKASKPAEEQMSEQNENMPVMTLMTADGGTSYSVGDTIDLKVTGDSKGADINGFDVLIGYDPAKMEVVSVQSAKPEFQLFKFPNPTYVSLTATKLLTINSATVFTGDSLVDIKMRAKKAGTNEVQLLSTQGRERTKMVDNQASIMIPSLNSVTLEVK